MKYLEEMKGLVTGFIKVSQKIEILQVSRPFP
jgi:hypothetical protein